MKRLFYIVALAALVLTSCKKETWADWRIENEVWLENIANQPGVKTTATGMRYKVLAQPPSTGQHPDDLKSVVILYKGSLIGPLNQDGFVDVNQRDLFDQNSDSTKWMAVSQLVSGFAEGLRKMTPNSHYILYIPYDLAYGVDGTGTEGGTGYIPPYSTLIFDVTLLYVK